MLNNGGQGLSYGGSMRWVTDANQNIMVSYVYEGFGKIVGQNGGGGGAYQWCGLWGYRNDWDAGLMHVGARYYEVETERWLQKDPIFGHLYMPQTLNMYVYVTNNPINYIDPVGTSTWTVVGIIVGGIIGALLGGIISGGQPWVIASCAVSGAFVGFEIGHAVDFAIEAKRYIEKLKEKREKEIKK